MLWSLAFWFQGKQFRGARGASVGLGCFRGSKCFVFPLRAGLRLFFCIELLMRIFFCVWVIDFQYNFECIFVYTVKFLVEIHCLNYVIVMTWTIWSTCTFGHEFKLLLIIKMRVCIEKYNRKINFKIENETSSLRS